MVRGVDRISMCSDRRTGRNGHAMEEASRISMLVGDGRRSTFIQFIF
jgi:hypothetical protein